MKKRVPSHVLVLSSKSALRKSNAKWKWDVVVVT